MSRKFELLMNPPTARLDGKKLNTTNDLAIDRKGRIWFTDPWNEGNVATNGWEPRGLGEVSVKPSNPLI